ASRAHAASPTAGIQRSVCAIAQVTHRVTGIVSDLRPPILGAVLPLLPLRHGAVLHLRRAVRQLLATFPGRLPEPAAVTSLVASRGTVAEATRPISRPLPIP